MKTRFNRPIEVACLALTLSACGPAQGTRPHDMSTSGHEEAAQAEQAEAADHEAQYDPVALRALHCGSTATAIDLGGGCWNADVNPTEAHRAQARRHRESAAAHRAAGEALRNAERRACVGIDELDRDMSPFANRADIESVARLTDRPAGSQRIDRLVGATVVFRAAPGMTEQWLQRVIDCHLARNASLGHEVPEMSYCPLVPSGASASVRGTGDGFAVDIRGADTATAQEIWQRAETLTLAGEAPDAS